MCSFGSSVFNTVHCTTTSRSLLHELLQCSVLARANENITCTYSENTSSTVLHRSYQIHEKCEAHRTNTRNVPPGALSNFSFSSGERRIRNSTETSFQFMISPYAQYSVSFSFLARTANYSTNKV